MTLLRQALADYLTIRRALGYRLARAEKLLAQFLTYLEDRGETRLRTETALAWATLPAGKDPRAWWASRLAVVRGFATFVHTIDPATEIPPADLLQGRARRATPYLYTDEDIAALLAATSRLRTAHRAATYRTLIGLLVVTGMRVGEAIALDRHDFDAEQGLITVRHGKLDKSRALPLHSTASAAVQQYLHRADRPAARDTAALFRFYRRHEAAVLQCGADVSHPGPARGPPAARSRLSATAARHPTSVRGVHAARRLPAGPESGGANRAPGHLSRARRPEVHILVPVGGAGVDAVGR